jgi:hypothetical protein
MIGIGLLQDLMLWWLCRVPFAVLFIPLNSMIISFGNGVQMETTLPRMLEILLEAKEF